MDRILKIMPLINKDDSIENKIESDSDDFAKRAFSFKRPALEMHIGKPLFLPAITEKGTERRQALQANTTLLMRHLAALLPMEYRGVYSFEDE